MFFFCECLNISVAISDQAASGLKVRDPSTANGTAGSLELMDFMRKAMGPFTLGQVSIQHEVLVSEEKLDKWNLHRCMNCDEFCYATGDDGKQLLVNRDLLRDEAQLNSLKNCDKYSMPFKIVLKSSDSNKHGLGIQDDPRVKSLFAKLQDFIARDASNTESEIRRLTEEMNQRRYRAEKDFQRLAALISSGTSTSTKSLSDENIESLTPPVTPESINEKMTIDDHPQLPHVRSTPMPKKQPFVSRNIDFEPIFDMDGMQAEGAANDVDRYHKYSDTEDGSDGERIVEKRPLARGRSGSINIARSAPITVPQFNPQMIHLIDDEDDEDDDGKVAAEPQPQQMDIASSIKMIARSVHTDSIFGELPAAPRARFQTEF